MYRIEIVANQSIQDDLIELLEEVIPNILYTVIPLVQGRGKNDRKLGDTTWPETNFLLFSYIDDDKVETVRAVVAAIKKQFSGEGIKLFTLKDAEVKAES